MRKLSTDPSTTPQEKPRKQYVRKAKSQTVTRSTRYEDLYDLLTAHEAAAYSGKTEWAIYQNVREGTMPHIRIGKKSILIPKTVFDPKNAIQQEAVAK